MNVKEIQSWAAKMGFKGKVPERLVTPHTVSMWKQLVEKVKPKEEVRRIKNNVLIDRIRGKGTSQTAHEFPIKNYDLWNKKQMLLKENEEIRGRVLEKQHKVDCSATENGEKYVKIESLRRKMKEVEQKTFLFELKAEQLRGEIAQSEERLTFCKNLTPIEADQNKSDVLKTLNKCAEKIQKLTSEQNLNPCDECSWNNPTVAHSDDQSLSVAHPRAVCASNEMSWINDASLVDDVTQILYNNDNYIMGKLILDAMDSKRTELTQLMHQRVETNRIPPNVEYSNSISKLHGLVIQNELRAFEYEREIKRLRKILKKQEREFIKTLESQDIEGDELEQLQCIYTLQKCKSGLNARSQCLLRQLKEVESFANYEIELRNAEIKSLNMQQKMIEEMRTLEYKLLLYRKVHTSMLNVREETFMYVRKLNRFTDDLSWTFPLTQDVCTNELKTFSNFSLEFNRRINLNGTRTFTKDLLTDAVCDAELGSEIVNMLVTLFDTPCSPPETLLLRLIQSKMEVRILKSLQSAPADVRYVKYDRDELRKQEAYVDYAVEKIRNLLGNRSWSRVSWNLGKIEEIVRLWMEMPIKDFISPNRLFNGYNFLHYYNLYENCYKKLD